MLELAFGFVTADLYRHDGLARLDAVFRQWLASRDPDLDDRLERARAASAPAPAELLIDLAPPAEAFVATLFGIEADVAAMRAEIVGLAPLAAVKRNFVQRVAVKGHDAASAAAIDGPVLRAALEDHIGQDFAELDFARAVLDWEAKDGCAEPLALARDYAAWATLSPAGQARHGGGVLFKVPRKTDPEHLVRHLVTDEAEGFPRHRLDPAHLRARDGFGLTDAGTDLAGACDQANYCIWCHHQGKDSCSKGLRDRQGAFRQSPFGVTLAGCPLEEKISEMHEVFAGGAAIGALAVITLDNPMAAATGHRICNDCMKACIYQRQDPVDIPQAETRILKSVLALPYGFEIYGLLTRWNPLNLRRPFPRPPSGRRVLVAGMGPAGFTLAHHLMNEGHFVVGIDGLKIEPLPGALADPSVPIRDIASLREDLDDRVMAGFGGVAEYGITVRWDKNFLKIVRLLLERRDRFLLLGGVRFGGTLTLDDAFAQGFDHVALAVGAGRPTVLELPHGLARGVRTASDFLMALQLTGAAKRSSIANMQLRLPVVVIGGGLTAIDAATEAMAYYPVQVEKFLDRYETLSRERGEAAVRAAFTPDEAVVADEFLVHGRAVRAERMQAAAEGRPPRLAALVQGWGGVTIAYRRRLIDSPSYTLNHEEVEKALEEGISFCEGLTPRAVDVDASGHAAALRLTGENGADVVLAARAVLVAAGTQPNTVLAREDAGNFVLAGKYFRAVDDSGATVTPERQMAKPAEPRVLLARHPDGRFVSFFGDLHPSYFGNVVKAMGSAAQGYPTVCRVLDQVTPAPISDAAFAARLRDNCQAHVHAVHRLTPTIVEVVVRAPQAARNFRPGQFYRLQNYEQISPRIDGTVLAMEGLALTGASVDTERGLLSTIVLEMGGSSDLCAHLRPGEPVVLMGPTGAPTHIAGGETVLLVGGGLGNAVLFSIGRAFREAGSRVLYFAGYKRMIDRYKVAEIEAAADVVVWCCDEAPGFAPGRPQDRSTVANIVEAIADYAAGEPAIPLSAVDRIIAIGSDRMMAAVAAARHGVLARHLKAAHLAIGSINSPMQCMMKEICAQCLQPQVDPATGATTHVFSCFNQDQPLDCVDWPALNDRLRQNAAQEKLTRQWIDRSLKGLGLRS
ncbi:MAG: FAD-dependent oxidoreductase [Alphaproteobacteria bacterium]|jgi:NADPH-dependent glutamate synthase beta subunit-like oxidoreductase/NAD(P)H-flavin reductase|nr:FAD-dependent oxidoreductase [Alphaproteobacteria bacterium]